MPGPCCMGAFTNTASRTSQGGARSSSYDEQDLSGDACVAPVCIRHVAAVEAAAAQSPSAQVDEVFQKMDSTHSPGCALSVMKDGRIVYERGYGMADLDHDVPITPGTVFHVASMSKQFTAASIVLLAQQGKLSLDDPVRKYIPELHDSEHRSRSVS